MFFCFYCFAVSIGKDDLIEADIASHWMGETKDSSFFIGSSDGFIHCIDIAKQKIIWSLNTTGSVCESVSTGATTFVPSIDGYLFTFKHEQGFRRLSLPIRDLVFVSPFKTESGEIFTAGKSATIFFVNKYNGSIISSYESKLPSSTRMNDNENLNDNRIVVVRVDYDLSVFDGNHEFVRFSEYEIFSGASEKDDSYSLHIEAYFSGIVHISVNDSRFFVVNTTDVVTSVFGSTGKLPFEMRRPDMEMAKSNVVFLTTEAGSIAFPAKPISAPSKFEMIVSRINAAPPQNKDDTLSSGVHKVRGPFVSFRKVEFNSRNPGTVNDFVEPSLIIMSINYGVVSLSLIIVYIFIRVFEHLVLRMKLIEKNIDPILIDSASPDKGFYKGLELSLIRIKNLNNESLEIARSVGSNVFRTNFVKDQSENGITILGFKKYGSFDSNSIDPVNYLERILLSLKSLFDQGIVHGCITESVLFSENGSVLLGGVEWNCRMSNTFEDRAKDVKDVSLILKNSQSYKYGYNILLDDLLNELTNDTPNEIPLPQEALCHPLFWDIEKKINLYYKLNDFLYSIDSNTLFIYESQKIRVLQCVSWMKKLPRLLKKDLKTRGDYAGDSLKDLVRMIRNKIEHCNETPEKLFPLIGNTPVSLFCYFDLLFPHLFLYSYYFLDKYMLN